MDAKLYRLALLVSWGTAAAFAATVAWLARHSR